jgi:hypothetical protein
MTAPAADFDRCTRCVLPAAFPGLVLDEHGVCQYCRAEPDPGQAAERRAHLRQGMEEAITRARQNDAPHQCIVAYSGGKDSTYTLLMLVRDYGLRCLAVTVDNGFLSETAMDNCRCVSDALGVDHIFFKPAFGIMQQIYLRSLRGGVHAPSAIKRASDVCGSCINLINTHMLSLAVQNRITLIAGGYLGGQVPKDSAVLDLDLDVMRRARATTLARYRERFGDEAARYFAVPDSPPSDRDNNWRRVTVINPLLTVAYSESELVAAIAPLGWARPADTGGHSSNCRLNDVGILAHQRRYGFHPYAFDGQLVRRDHGSRRAIARLGQMPRPEDLGEVLSKLGIAIDEL